MTALSVLKLLPYPAASHPSGSVRFKGQELLGLSEDKIRHVRGNDITIIFQEPMTSLNPLHTIEKQIGEILLLHQGLTGQAARVRTLELLTQVGIPEPDSPTSATVSPFLMSKETRSTASVSRVPWRNATESLSTSSSFSKLASIAFTRTSCADRRRRARLRR